MNLVPITDEALWTPARDLTVEERVMHQQTFAEMRELMFRLRGVGLSFPQIGLSLRAFISGYEHWPVVINPSWKPVGKDHVSKLEGCLSKPGWHTYVRRPEQIYAEWQDVDGFRKTRFLDGVESRVFQHEGDHLAGLPIFPKPSGKSRGSVTIL